MTISKKSKTQETAEVETEIDPTVEVETIQETTIEITTGMVVEIITTEIEVESHDVDNISDHEGICQVLFDEIDGIKDQSDVYRRAGRAISGLSQSNQWRLSKSEGEPGTPLPATKSDRQSQKVGLGNLSLNSPNELVGDIFHYIYCYSKCVSMDESGIWSILTDTLHCVKPEIDSSVI